MAIGITRVINSRDNIATTNSSEKKRPRNTNSTTNIIPYIEQ